VDAFPDLFVDYCTRYDAVEAFYAGNWQNPEVRAQAAREAARRPVDRDGLADVLAEQNARWDADAHAQQSVDQLRDPKAVAIVTGQQVGLFTGPLYTIYKTLTVLQQAEAGAQAWGCPVVPIFWMAGEDHDFAEVAEAVVLHRNAPVALRYEARARLDDTARGAVGRLSLTEAITDVLDDLDDALPPSDFKPDVMAAVREAYAPGTTLTDAFATLLHRLFAGSGLVCISPDDARLKAQARPLFRRDLLDPTGAVERIDAASDALVDAGYHQQVHARPTNLFWLDSHGRYPIDYTPDGDGGAFTLRHDPEARTFSQDALLQHLDDAPERFSPNVVLRPLMQDRLLPTVSYVAGPGEISYFAQYKGVYDWAEIPMPLIHPRASVTLLESKVTKVLEKFDLSLCDLTDDLDALFQQVVVDEMSTDVDALFGDAMRHVHEAINAVKPGVAGVDQTLVSSAEATRAALVDAMNDLKHKVVKAEKREQDQIRAQLQKAYVNLRPNGTLQERALNVLYFLNKYSPALLGDLREVLNPDATAHQQVRL
jgi:bacillithiol biosynthesis cysteine-adding enzyme BshC